MSTTLTDRTVSTWNDRVTLRVRVGGDGPPLVYLHPSAGLAWDPFLDALAEHFTIYAPSSRERRPATRTRSTRSTTCGTPS